MGRKEAREIALHLVFEFGFQAFESEEIVASRLEQSVLDSLSGMAGAGLRRVRTKLRGSFGKASPGRRLIRARFDGAGVCLTGDNHSSGSLSTMIGCNCLIDIPAGSEALRDGDEVEILLL